MSEIKLLPCPFCGGQARTGYAINDYNRWGVICTNCEACVEAAEWKGVADTEENAIRAWNTRKPIQEILERLEERKNRPPELEYRHLNFEEAIEICKEVGGMND